MRRQFRIPAAAGFFVAVVGLVGCGDGLRRVPVHGKVTAAGQPVDNAIIIFMPTGGTKGEGAIGRTDANGNFASLTGSREGAQGIVPGEYKVRVSRYINPDGTVLGAEYKQADNPLAIESIPGAYGGPEPPLKVTVPDSGGAVDIQIPAKLISGKKR